MVEEERCLEPSEFTSGGAGGASFDKPHLSRSVVTFEEKNWVGVMVGPVGNEKV